MMKRSHWISLFTILILLSFLGVSALAETKKNVRPYTAAEQKMVDDTNKAADLLVGWAKIGKHVVTANDIKRAGNNFDYWNPLWDNETYAANTRYGGIIAPPFYLTKLALSSGLDMVINPDVGNWIGIIKGSMWEFYKPVRAGDIIRVWQERPIIEDVTEGDGPRTFNITSSCLMINQKDEMVASAKSFIANSFSTGQRQMMPQNGGGPPVGGPGGFGTQSIPKYTEEDWKLIDNIAAAEEIRGAGIRYWEDVNVGDKPKWVIVEPTTVIDMIKFAGDQIMEMPPFREISRELGKQLSLDENGIYRQQVEGHFSARGGAGGFTHFNAFGESVMARLITNWMGDDGWLKKFDARTSIKNEIIKNVKDLQSKEMIGIHGSEGDAVIAKAEVIKKYIENGEHLVDVAIWTESIRGGVWQASKCTVKLISKEDAIKWK